MPFKTYLNWLFDGREDTPIPEPVTDNDGKVIVPDIMKYNSPITHTYAISLFIRNGALNKYLDTYFNNMDLRYLEKDELFYFLKKCVKKFRVSRREIGYKRFAKQDKLFNALRSKIPYLKNDDIRLLMQIIDNSDEKNIIYHTLGLEVEKKKKITKTERKKREVVPLKKFLEENFILHE